jgi:hypothetical protein
MKTEMHQGHAMIIKMANKPSHPMRRKRRKGGR